MEKTDFRKKLMFTFAILAVYKLGAYIPIPWIDQQVLADFYNQSPDISFIGGIQASSRIIFGPILSIFALGIMPYIGAAIFMELIIFAFPALSISKLAEDVEGRNKIFRFALYLTIPISIINSLAISASLELMRAAGGGLLVPSPGWGFKLPMALTLTSGTLLLVWLAEQITRRGIGNGISLILLVGLVTRVPLSINNIQRGYETGEIKLALPFLGVCRTLAAEYGIMVGNKSLP